MNLLAQLRTVLPFNTWNLRRRLIVSMLNVDMGIHTNFFLNLAASCISRTPGLRADT